MFKYVTRLILLFCLCAITHAQVVDIPDPNLRAAIRDTLNLPGDEPITKSALQHLSMLVANSRRIESLQGLELATELQHLQLRSNQIVDIRPLANLKKLDTLIILENRIMDISTLANLTQLVELNVRDNPISDVSPLSNLRFLKYLDVSRCQIIDITPLERLTELRVLQLNHNQIVDAVPLANLRLLYKLEIHRNFTVDIQPLANLTHLAELNLSDNDIADVSPLANLTKLERLDIRGIPATNYTPLGGLALTHFLYEQSCELPPLPIHDRINDRNYPSVFTAWAGPHWVSILNRPDLSGVENVAMHDLWFSVPQFGLRFKETPDGFSMVGSLDEAIQKRDEFLALNPNILFIADIRMRSYALDEFPEDWPYWIKDSDGTIVNAWEGKFGLIDFTHPDIQDRIVQQAIAVSKCGLYDGIHFDWWLENGAVLYNLYGNRSHIYRGNKAEQEARDNILRRIRAETSPDFLIIANTSRYIIPRTAPHINGGFMITLIPYTSTGDHLEAVINQIETSLLWLEENLRQPRINGIEGWGIPAKTPDDPANLQWMRAITTLSLTHSDGYLLFNDGKGGHDHYWYDFWDADLGRPVGLTAQLYEEISGLYIREFTNGWAVYNRSGQSQTITLPEEVQAVASGSINTEHSLSNLDGEMYLRVRPSPADLNVDGMVNILDLRLVIQGFGTDKQGVDVNGDGFVNAFDLVFVADQFGITD